jgi:protein Tex
VDAARKRISLTMKLGEAPRRDGARENRFEGAGRGQRAPQNAPTGTAMGSAFAKLQGLRK